MIYLQPIGAMPEPFAKLLPTVRKYAEIYFQKPVVVQDPIVAPAGIASRINPSTSEKQWLTTDILELLSREMPKDAFCRVGLTLTDLYPDPDWNFVFGQARPDRGVGIYSFARYGSPDNRADFLRRCLRVLTHETGHLFGMGHCVYFQCLMNGTNHQAESDATPLFLCPICLRKLHGTQHVDLARRHFELAEFFSKNDLSPESGWMTMRAKALGLGSSETR